MIYFDHDEYYDDYLMTIDMYFHHGNHDYKAWSCRVSIKDRVHAFTICWKNREAYETIRRGRN